MSTIIIVAIQYKQYSWLMVKRMEYISRNMHLYAASKNQNFVCFRIIHQQEDTSLAGEMGLLHYYTKFQMYH